MLLNPVEGIPLFVSDGELLTGRESNPERDPAVGLSDKGSAGIEPAKLTLNLTTGLPKLRGFHPLHRVYGLTVRTTFSGGASSGAISRMRQVFFLSILNRAGIPFFPDGDIPLRDSRILTHPKVGKEPRKVVPESRTAHVQLLADVRNLHGLGNTDESEDCIEFLFEPSDVFLGSKINLHLLPRSDA